MPRLPPPSRIGAQDLFLQLSKAEAERTSTWREVVAAGVDAQIRQLSHTHAGRSRNASGRASTGDCRHRVPTAQVRQPGGRQALSAERGHAAVVQAAAGARGAGLAGGDIARAEPWHRRGSGNELRAAVLGANDGLVSNLSLVMGVAGAGASSATILLTGLAGLVAGALSMALGEWLSVTNSRELARTQIAREKRELEETPDAERKELALIFQAKGLPREDAQRVAREIMRDRSVALDTLARGAWHRPGGDGRQPVERRGILLCAFRCRCGLPGAAVLLCRGHGRHRVERRRERAGTCRHRRGHFALQRPQPGILGGAPGADRRRRCGHHIRNRRADRRFAFLIPPQPGKKSCFPRLVFPH
jgi:hypothetical protein